MRIALGLIILVLPLLADGIVMLVARSWSRLKNKPTSTHTDPVKAAEPGG